MRATANEGYERRRCRAPRWFKEHEMRFVCCKRPMTYSAGRWRCAVCRQTFRITAVDATQRKSKAWLPEWAKAPGNAAGRTAIMRQFKVQTAAAEMAE